MNIPDSYDLWEAPEGGNKSCWTGCRNVTIAGSRYRMNTISIFTALATASIAWLRFLERKWFWKNRLRPLSTMKKLNIQKGESPCPTL